MISTTTAPPATTDAPELAATFFIETHHPAVERFCVEHVGDLRDPRQSAVKLFYAVRDGFRYSPWAVADDPSAFQTSTVLARGPGGPAHCIDKANVMVACARRLGIPSRFHFADVRNHIGTERLEAKLGTDLLVFHGYVELWLGERWVAATPTFNRELCERLNVEPLEFDGVHDSIFQAFDRREGQFMEYVTDRGTRVDLPYEEMIAAWRQHYKEYERTGRWPKPDR